MTAKPPKVHKLPEPFEYVEVTVNTIRDYRAAEPFGLTVGIMDRATGNGTRSSIEFAEAKAKTVLKAIRAYRRAHPEHAHLEKKL